MKPKFFQWLAKKNTTKLEKSFPEFFLRYFSKFSLIDSHTKECLDTDTNLNCKLCNAEFLLRQYREFYFKG